MCVEAGLGVYEAQMTALLNRPDAEALLPAIDRPVLVATGEWDAWAPPDQHRAIAARLPRATLRIITGAGHMLPAEAPEAFNGVIAEWLALAAPPT